MKKNKRNTIKLRIFAMLIDFLILSIATFAIYIAMDKFKIGLQIIIPVIVTVCVLYPVVFELTPMSATPGMKMMKLFVVYEEQRKSFSAGISRALWRAFLCLPLGIGFWYALFDKNNRTLYDYASKSMVVLKLKRKKKHVVPCVYRRHGHDTYVSYIMEGDSLVFGRNADVCQVVFAPNEPGVSRCHCGLTYNRQTDMFLLEDLCSSYGTFLENGVKLTPGKPVVLSKDDRFYIGKKENEFVVGYSDIT